LCDETVLQVLVSIMIMLQVCSLTSSYSAIGAAELNARSGHARLWSQVSHNLESELVQNVWPVNARQRRSRHIRPHSVYSASQVLSVLTECDVA
jgi:hypothetical protein